MIPFNFNTQPIFRYVSMLLLLTAVTFILIACGGDADDGSTSATQLDSAVEITDSGESSPSTPVSTAQPTADPRITFVNEMLSLAEQANDFYIHGDMTAWQETVAEFESHEEEWGETIGDLDSIDYEQLGYESEEDFAVDFGTVVLTAAYLKYTQSNDEEALVAFNNVIDLGISQLSAAYSGRGHIYRLQDDLDKAAVDFDQAITLNSENADAYRGKAMLAYYQDDITTANEFLKQVLEINPEFGRVYILQGDIAYYELGDTVSADVFYEQGLQHEPGYADGYYARAGVYDATGRDGECVDDINEAISLKPNYDWYYYQRGFCRMGLGQYAIALDDFDTVISLEPSTRLLAATYQGKGDAYYNLEKSAEAIDAYSTGIDLDPNSEALYRWRAHAYRQAENYPNAIEDYTQALSIDPSIPWSYYGLGVSHDELNHYQDSYANYEIFMEMEPGDIYETRYACDRMNALHLYNSQNIFDLFLGTGCNRFPAASSGSTSSGGTGSADSCPYGVIDGVCVQSLSECPWGQTPGAGGARCVTDSEAGMLQSQNP